VHVSRCGRAQLSETTLDGLARRRCPVWFLAGHGVHPLGFRSGACGTTRPPAGAALHKRDRSDPPHAKRRSSLGESTPRRPARPHPARWAWGSSAGFRSGAAQPNRTSAPTWGAAPTQSRSERPTPCQATILALAEARDTVQRDRTLPAGHGVHRLDFDPAPRNPTARRRPHGERPLRKSRSERPTPCQATIVTWRKHATRPARPHPAPLDMGSIGAFSLLPPHAARRGRWSRARWTMVRTWSRSAPSRMRRGARTSSLPRPAMFCASLMYCTSLVPTSRCSTGMNQR
jgi:hypothetical protein